MASNNPRIYRGCSSSKTCIIFLDLGTASALLANLLAASAIIIVKILSRYDSTITIMLYTNIGITIVSFLFNIHGWQLLDLKDFILIMRKILIAIFLKIHSS